MGAKKVPDPSGRFPVRGTCSVSRPVVHLTIIGGWEAVMRLLRSVWRFCMKYRTTPRGPAVFQASLYEISYNSKRSVRFPSDYVRNIVQLQAVRPFSKRLCTKYRTTPRGPAVFQAILYEISYNSIRSGHFPSDFVRNIVQLQAVRPFSKRFCTKYRTTPRGPAVFQAILYEISYNSIRSGRFSSDYVRNVVQLCANGQFQGQVHHCV
jgi:hypothetical protein